MLDLAQNTRSVNVWLACLSVCMCAFVAGGPPTTCEHQHTHSNQHIHLPTPQNSTTVLLHCAPQLIADPAPNLFIVYYITQSHVQSSQSIIAPQTSRNCAGELIIGTVPDETARGATVVVVWCTVMIHACLGCEVCWSPTVVAWDARPHTKQLGVCDL